jgi:DNA modification methylase
MIDFHEHQNGIAMNKKSLVIRFSFLVLFLLISSFFTSGLLLPQEKPGPKNYNPVEGQEGKDVRWFPTPQELVDKMLDMAKVTPADFLVDLGSGDGRTVITAAKRGVRAVGIEYNGDLVELAKQKAAKNGVAGKAEFIKADLFA